MQPIDYVAAVQDNADRFADRIAVTPMDTAVPSCPGWTVADLAWHLTGVQHRFAFAVADLLMERDQIPDLDRPADADLPALFRRTSAKLVEALGRRDPQDRCWTWKPGANTVGWVRRRMAHETLIHRVDAELASGSPSAVDPILGADGVDEIIEVNLDAGSLPEWATFQSEATAVLLAEGESASWSLDLGRFRGTSPRSGKTYDDPSMRLVESVDRPDAVISGSGDALDLWLWGRGPLERLKVEGDRDVALRIRTTAASRT